MSQAESIEWAPYSPGNCVICRVLCAIVRWHSPNNEKPARLPDGPSMHNPQDHIVWGREGGRVLTCRGCSFEHLPTDCWCVAAPGYRDHFPLSLQVGW